MVKMAKLEAILGAAMRMKKRMKGNLEKGRQPPEKMFIFGKFSIKKTEAICLCCTSLPSIYKCKQT